MTPAAKRLLEMTPEEITEEWIRRQREARDKGEPHYTVLRESNRRGKIVATIDGPVE